MMVLPYYLSYTLPAVVGLGVLLGGWWILLSPVYLFVLVPLLDVFGGFDRENPAERKGVNRDLAFDLPLWLWAPTLVALVGWSAYRIGSYDYSAWEILGISVNVGLVGGAAGINVAHELMHRRGKFERALSEIMLLAVSYAHFTIEHVMGHHRRVSTPEDPASSRFGESLYTFLPRSLFGGYVSAWELETLRVKKKGAGPLHLQDRRLRQTLLTVGIYTTLALTLGWKAVVFFAAQSLVAMILLETINYIEHYGLERREIAPGKYERTQPHHSWNASQRVTNWFLFNLQRHSDHHYLASRPYWQLRHFDEVPQMPYGYATMFLMAFAPRLWKRVMDPRVLAWRAQRELDGDEGGASAPA